MAQQTNDDCKRLVQTFFEEVVERGRVELLDTIAAPDMLDHAAEPSGWKPGRDGFVQHIQYLHSGASELGVELDDVLAEDGRVVVYWTLRGKHTGEWFGVPATGREFTGTAISRVTFVDHQITDYLVRPDLFGLLQQLGALPT